MKKLMLLSGLLLLLSCNSNQNDSYIASSTVVETTLADPEHPGKALLEKNCYACHNASAAHEDRIAPPMIAVKMHYLSEGTSKEEFTAALLEWTREPSEDKAKMFGAVKRFGVMPYQSFPEETIRQISEYIYEYDIEAPEWFAEHHGEGMGNGKGQGMQNGKGMGNGNCSENCSGNCKGMQMQNGQGQGMGKGQGKGKRQGMGQSRG
jgi:hypothetical protein